MIIFMTVSVYYAMSVLQSSLGFKKILLNANTNPFLIQGNNKFEQNQFHILENVSFDF